MLFAHSSTVTEEAGTTILLFPGVFVGNIYGWTCVGCIDTCVSIRMVGHILFFHPIFIRDHTGRSQMIGMERRRRLPNSGLVSSQPIATRFLRPEAYPMGLVQ